jgi:hypothetical protein
VEKCELRRCILSEVVKSVITWLINMKFIVQLL